MGIRFNADEVLAMAIKTEQNGAAFYRKAAEQHTNEADCAFLTGLAEMEDGHAMTFTAMKNELSEKEKGGETYDPNDEASLYLDTFADARGGEGAPSVADTLTGDESLADILKIAIGLEKEAILFYIGLKDLVPAALGADKIDAIIAEEKGHVVTLSRELGKL